MRPAASPALPTPQKPRLSPEKALLQSVEVGQSVKDFYSGVQGLKALPKEVRRGRQRDPSLFATEISAMS